MISQEDVAAGTRVGGFVVEALVGVGGMARVYRAHQPGVDRPVALKVLAPEFSADPAFARRFRREAGVMRDLEHPGVLSVYAAGEDGGRFYLATRLVDGDTLADRLARGRLAWDEAQPILSSVADALDHVHGRGVVHRDVKPANVLIDPEGRAYLADFGISKAIGTTATHTGHYVGTPRYMAPEQARDGSEAVGHRADIYSLACMAYEMATGRPPYAGDDAVPLLIAHATQPVPRAGDSDPTLPAGVDAVLTKALAKRPADRHPSGRAFVDELSRAMAGPRSRRRRRPYMVAACVALALIAALVVTVVPGASTAVPVGEPAAIGPEGSAGPAPQDLGAVPRRGVFYEAPMDGTPAGFILSPATEAQSAREAVRYVPGAVELEVYARGGKTYSEADLAGDSVTTYLGEMNVAVRPGSEVALCWTLRRTPEGLGNEVCIDPGRGQAVLRSSRRGHDPVPLGQPAGVDGMSSGRVVHLAVLVRERQISLYVDGRLASEAATELPVSRTQPRFSLDGTSGTGSVAVRAWRFSKIGPMP